VDINVEYLAGHFSYSPDTGDLVRLTRKNSNGSTDAYGYTIIKFNGVQLKSHRICFALHYGFWPVGVIDHIDGDKTNNRIKNLRDVAQAVNVRNTKREPNKDTGIVGVYLDKTAGLKAIYATKIFGKTRRFRNTESAIMARQQSGVIA